MQTSKKALCRLQSRTLLHSAGAGSCRSPLVLEPEAGCQRGGCRGAHGHRGAATRAPPSRSPAPQSLPPQPGSRSSPSSAPARIQRLAVRLLPPGPRARVPATRSPAPALWGPASPWSAAPRSPSGSSGSSGSLQRCAAAAAPSPPGEVGGDRPRAAGRRPAAARGGKESGALSACFCESGETCPWDTHLASDTGRSAPEGQLGDPGRGARRCPRSPGGPGPLLP